MSTYHEPIVYSDYETDSIKCAHCGSNNLHHDTVLVTQCWEDAETGLQVLIGGDDNNPFDRVEINNDLRYYNPSSRRHGIAISLWCEHCSIGDNDDPKPDYGPRTLLLIYQHKGTTFFHVVKQTSSLVQVRPAFAAKRQAKILQQNVIDFVRNKTT